MSLLSSLDGAGVISRNQQSCRGGDNVSRPSQKASKTLTFSLPSLSAPKKPRPIIEYAKTTRHALLKYLAILRWKAAVDLVAVLPDAASQTQLAQAGGAQVNGGTQHFPTPLSLSDSTSNSPATQQGSAYSGKGKGKATDEDVKPSAVIRGKVTDAKRIQQFMEHQNLQHDRAIEHVQHAQRIVENFRQVTRRNRTMDID